MKRIIAALLIVAVAGIAIANEDGRHDDDRHDGMHHGDLFAEEYADILSQYRDRTPANLTFGEIEELSGALSIPAQKMAYVRHSAMASMLVPGLGQFKNGDALAGTLFLLSDIAIVAGTAVGLYFLLPPELQFGQLDYFNTPPTDIHAAWETAHETATFREMLPIMSVATGGLILKHVVSHLSARHAYRLATENIQNGTVTFEPRGGMMGPGRMGMGFGIRY
jgi:hypothetical protein